MPTATSSISASASEETLRARLEPFPIAIGLVWFQRQLLVGRRDATMALGGFAEFPGGKCEPGEAPHHAVVREVLEETGIAVDAALRLQTEYTYPHGRLRLYFFDCVPTGRGGELAPRAPFRWVSVADLPSLAFPPANGAVLESLRHCPEPVVPCQ